MTTGSGCEGPHDAYRELEERCLRARAALEGLSGEPIPPPLLLERVKEANRLARGIGSFFRELRLHSVREGDRRPMSLLAGQLPLELLKNHTKEIERCMKWVSEQGAPNPNIVRPPLVAFRARALRLERRQNLISPRDRLAFEKAVQWAADSGGREELRLLRQIKTTLQGRNGETLDLVTLAESQIGRRVRERNGLLAAVSNFRQAPEAALRAIGEIGLYSAERRSLRPTLRDLSEEANPVPALGRVLAAAEDRVLQAEAAWALGQVGGVQAARRLLRHLDHPWDAKAQPVELRAALVAGLGQALDTYSLYRLARANAPALRGCYEGLLEEAGHLGRLDAGHRVDLVGTLVALELRSERVGVDLRAGSSLALSLGAGAAPAIQAIAAAAALQEMTTAGERRELWHWLQGGRAPAARLMAWPDRLSRAAGRPFSPDELRGFLLAASRLDAIREDVEASYLAGRVYGAGVGDPS